MSAIILDIESIMVNKPTIWPTNAYSLGKDISDRNSLH